MACVRPGTEVERTGSVASLISETTDWDRLLELAAYHRVRGPLCRGLMPLAARTVPPGTQESLESMARAAKLKNKFLIGEMGRVQSLLVDEGVDSIAFKGPILAYMAYQDGQYRITRDIDLLVSPETFERATSVLTQDDYRPFWDQGMSSLSRPRSYLNQQATLIRGRSFTIDLHSSLTPVVHASGASFSALWDRSVRRTVEETCVRILHPVDRLLMLCQQGIKNRWDRLKYTCDLAECLKVVEDLDWTSLWDEAQRTSQARLLLTNLVIVHDLFHTPLPDFLHDAIERDRHAEKIGAWGIGKLQSRFSSGEVSVSERVWVYWTIQDTLSHRFNYVVYSLLRNLWAQYESIRSAAYSLWE